MYAYSSFPSRFAVFRGPYHSTLRTELVDSTMVFDTTPSEDGSFYTATLRPWFGNIVGDDNMPDKMVRQVKIHSPSRKDHYGNPFSPSNERFVVLPFTLEVNTTSWVHNRIPILAFESTNWMPRFDRLSEIQMLHRIQGDLFKYHYQNIHHIARILILRQPLTRDRRWVHELPDPYSITNSAEIRAIPYPFLSPTTIYNMRVNVIYHLSSEAAAAARDIEDYSSTFDAAAGYVASAEELLLQEEPLLHEEPPALPIIPDFILENHLAHEVQKGTECPITFEPLSSLAEVAMSRDCGHFFEQTALKAWGKVQQNEGAPIVCPVCRKQLSEVVTMTNNYYIKPVVAA